jgi:hypothetical protein
MHSIQYTTIRTSVTFIINYPYMCHIINSSQVRLGSSPGSDHEVQCHQECDVTAFVNKADGAGGSIEMLANFYQNVALHPT